jgi:hypothetical protein
MSLLEAFSSFFEKVTILYILAWNCLSVTTSKGYGHRMADWLQATSCSFPFSYHSIAKHSIAKAV